MAFPVARDFLLRTAQELGASPGRAKLVSLPPGRRVYPHIDRGEYYRLHARFHLVLRSPQGSFLRAGDEEITMREGELWWFDNKQVHEAHNHGDENRIHLIFDLLPRASRGLAFGQDALEPPPERLTGRREVRAGDRRR
jgi:aspartyl/asparaginyl beta-hydroxylase (cupin superfamily)